MPIASPRFSQADVKNLVALAEALQVPVIDKLGRMNFPTNHYLNGSGTAMQGGADLILALDPGDLWSYVDRLPESIARISVRTARADCKVISIDSELLVGAGNYQDKQRFYQADLAHRRRLRHGAAVAPKAVNSAMPAARRNENPQREAAMREAFYLKRQSDMAYAAIGWDSQPISVARMCMELYNAIKGEMRGRSSRRKDSKATGRAGNSGTPRITVSSMAARARRASATSAVRRSARRWVTGITAAACA